MVISPPRTFLRQSTGPRGSCWQKEAPAPRGVGALILETFCCDVSCAQSILPPEARVLSRCCVCRRCGRKGWRRRRSKRKRLPRKWKRLRPGAGTMKRPGNSEHCSRSVLSPSCCAAHEKGGHCVPGPLSRESSGSAKEPQGEVARGSSVQVLCSVMLPLQRLVAATHFCTDSYWRPCPVDGQV